MKNYSKAPTAQALALTRVLSRHLSWQVAARMLALLFTAAYPVAGPGAASAVDQGLRYRIAGTASSDRVASCSAGCWPWR